MNVMRIICVTLMMPILMISCGHFDKWTRGDKILQGMQLGVQGVDWLQTREIARNDDFYETNPRIGKYPTEWEVDRYFIMSAGFGMLVTHILPQEGRKYWLSFRIGVFSQAAIHNYNIGIRIKL